jgi:hypothetical protein
MVSSNGMRSCRETIWALQLRSSLLVPRQDGTEPVRAEDLEGGRLRCCLPLLGMGLRRLSMSPAFVPPLKDLIRRVSQPMTSAIADRVLQMKTTQEIRDYLTAEVRQIWPEATLLDTGG